MATSTQRTNARSSGSTSTSVITREIDNRISEARNRVEALEAVKAMLVDAEPVARPRTSRKRKFQGSGTVQQTTAGQAKRGPGRPKGSKNKPKVSTESTQDNTTEVAQTETNE